MKIIRNVGFLVEEGRGGSKNILVRVVAGICEGSTWGGGHEQLRMAVVGLIIRLITRQVFLRII